MQEQLNTIQPQSIQRQIPQTQLPDQQGLSQQSVTQQQTVLPTYSLPPAIKGTVPPQDISKQDLIKRDAKRRLEHATQGHSKRQDLFKDEKSLSSRIIAISAGSLLVVILIIVAVIVINKAGTEFGNMREQVADSVGSIAENVAENIEERNGQSSNSGGGPKTSSSPVIPSILSDKRKIQLQNGSVEIEGDGDYGEWCSLHYERNDGLILECEFKRGGLTEFGYDLTEPTVNRTMSKFAAFVIARTIIKNFLDGDYD